MLGGAAAIEAVRSNESIAYAGVQGVHGQSDAATMLRRTYLPDDVVANINTGATCGAYVGTHALLQLGHEPYPLTVGRVWWFGRQAQFLPNQFSYSAFDIWSL